MADVVISYKKEDKNRVSGIAEKLRALRVATWFDAQLPNGVMYDEAIAAELERANCILVCWTPAALASDYVRAEAMVGYNRSKLAACALDRTPDLDNMPPFNLVQRADLFDWRGEDHHEGWLKLVHRIAELTNRPGLPEYAGLLASGKKTPAGLAAWKARYPSDPLAQANWSETQARSLQAKKTIAKNRRKSSAVGLLAASIVLLVILGAGVTAWLSGAISNLSREASAETNANHLGNGWCRLERAFDMSGVPSAVLSSDRMARATACQAIETAKVARANANEAIAAATNGAVSSSAPSEASRFCGDLPYAGTTTALVFGETEGQVLTLVVCNNSDRFEGRLDYATGVGSGRLTSELRFNDTTQVRTFEGDFRQFKPDGFGMDRRDIDQNTYVGNFSNNAGNGPGQFWLNGDLSDAPTCDPANPSMDGDLVFSGDVIEHDYGNGIEWARKDEFAGVSAGSARRMGYYPTRSILTECSVNR